MNIKKGWKAKLESAYSFLLKHSKITVNFEYIGQNTYLILVLYIYGTIIYMHLLHLLGIATGIRDEINTVLHQANLTLIQILKVGFCPRFSILTETSKLTKIRSKLN